MLLPPRPAAWLALALAWAATAGCRTPDHVVTIDLRPGEQRQLRVLGADPQAVVTNHGESAVSVQVEDRAGQHAQGLAPGEKLKRSGAPDLLVTLQAPAGEPAVVRIEWLGEQVRVGPPAPAAAPDGT